MNIDELVAIDIHTHAEEPCCGTRDDGYEIFQAGMAKYFNNPGGAEGMLPSVQQTADYYRERRIGCVIFPSTPSGKRASAATRTRKSRRSRPKTATS